MEIRRAKEKDILQIKNLFIDVYGNDYPFKEFYDTEWHTKSIYSDNAVVLVADEDDEITATGSVIFTAGAFSDLVGEFGRVVVSKNHRYKGLGNEITSELVREATKVVQFGFAECRSVHSGAQRICEECGFSVTGFEPLKYRMVNRESPVFVTRLFDPAISLRRNNPRVISSIYPLAAKSLQNLGLGTDIIVEDDLDGYPIDKTFDIEELQSDGVSSLLRIERGRVSNPEVFGNLSLSYGFFKIATNQANYLVARDKDVVLGAIGFTHDLVDNKVKVFELIAYDEEVSGFLLSSLDKLSVQKYKVDYIEIDVSAYSPKIQRTLDNLGFVAVAYCPSMVFRGVERLDVIRMAKLTIPPEIGETKFTEKSEEMMELVMRCFEEKKVGMRITEITKKLDIFLGLSDGEISKLARICREVSYPNGTVIAHQGEQGNDVFALIEGTASVVNVEAPGKPKIGAIGPGEIFGEMSIIELQPRNAELIADVDAKLVAINRNELTNLMNRNHHLGKVVMTNIARGLSQKLRRFDADFSIINKKIDE